ncbi:TPA: hypothetical protein OE741_003430 [Escherichia coli]|nr:hypothetical protein [Escherichia coli]
MQTEQQRAVTRLCIQCGLFLLQHGAESALVDEAFHKKRESISQKARKKKQNITE